MSTDIVTVERRIDDGQPLALGAPPESLGVDGFAVSTLVCDNPDCPCARMGLVVQALRLDEAGIGHGEGPELDGRVSCDGGDLELASDRPGAFTDAAVEWIRERLGEPGHRAWLAERWRRMRGMIGDPAYPSGVVPEQIDGMVPFHEVFPWDFDLTVFHEGQLYLVEDHYCLEPGCTCDNVIVPFIPLRTEDRPARAVGHAKASVRRLGAPTIDGPPVLHQLWRAMLDEHGSTKLRDRFKRMRQVPAARRRVAPPKAGPRPGRNDPCPCGSAKKYKRCCGR